MKALCVAIGLAAGPVCLAAGAAMAGPAGEAVTKWDGASHDTYFASPVEWARFQLLLTSDEFREIRQATEAETRARVEGGYLVLTGCLVRACTSTRAGLAVSVADGTPLAVVWQRDRAPKVFGAEPAALPATLKALAETGALP